MPSPDLPSPIAAEEIFRVAAALPATERGAYLDAACEGQPEVRARLERMLDVSGVAAFPQNGRNEIIPPEIEAELARLKPEEGGERIGNYKLLQQIGEGGHGTVWMAEQIEPVRRRVALKIIKLGMDTKEVIARFEQERQALALMDHPNIAKVHDAGATPTGRPFFVMELVHGIKITEYCDQANLRTAERLALFITVCKAVQHAHQKGVIHRDLKPSNILVTLHDGAPVPKVIDFGVAKATQSQRLTDLTLFTHFEQMIGTPLYMSPEQAEMSGLDIDTRSDIYSLGVVLYELLTGCTPFDPEELMRKGQDEIRRAIREQEPPKPSTALHTMAVETRTTIAHHRQSDGTKLITLIRGDLDWIVMKALEKDRTRRYETANGLALDIKRHLDNEPVLARPASTLYRLRRLVRRNKLVFTAATAVALVLVAGIAVSTWQTVAARKSQQETELARTGEQQQRLEAQAAQKVAETEQQRADAQARKASESEQKSRRLLYASDMNFTQQSLKLNNLGRARRLLERHRPNDREEDLRGWEWRYLWQLTRSSAILTLTNRPLRGFAVGFSPDGSRLAVGWMDGQVDLWDVPGRRLIRTLTDHRSVRALTKRVYTHQGRLAFSPVRTLLAATAQPQVVALYDLDSGTESIVWRAPDDGVWDVRDLAFSHDGSKLVIYAGSTPELGDAVWVVNVSDARIESHHPTGFAGEQHFGAARLSPDHRHLYLPHSEHALIDRYRIRCIDLGTGRELWQTEPRRDVGVTTLDISPDGLVLASGSGYEDPTIRIWDAATGQLRRELEGHTGWVGDVSFSRDGRRLISAAADQSIRFWETNNWTETKVLRGHTDEVHAVAISEPAQLVASAGKDGNILLWQEDGKSAADGYSRLPENLGVKEVLPLDDSRLLLLPPGKPPECFDLRRDSRPVPLPGLGSSADVLGCFGRIILCHSNGTNQILVRELRGMEVIEHGAIALDSGARPTGSVYNARRHLAAWTEAASLNSIYLMSLAARTGRIELRSDVPGLVPLRFSEDGKYLVARTGKGDLRVWNLESGQMVASINEPVLHSTFAADGDVLVVAIVRSPDHEIALYDLVQPARVPRRLPGREICWALAVSPDGAMVAASTGGGEVRLVDSTKWELMERLHGHLNSIGGVAFSQDGRRLISASGGRETVKVWDVGTRQELLTLSGTGSFLAEAKWSADGETIVAGPPWQAWWAPSWEEIAEIEAKANSETQQR